MGKPPATTDSDIYSEIGRLTMAAADADTQMTVLLARLMTDNQEPPLSLVVPSIVIFAARSIDQKQELIRNVFEYRCHKMFREKAFTNIHKAATFTEKAMNLIFTSIKTNAWIRNIAAHGTVVGTGDGGHALIPNIVDIVGHHRLVGRSDDYKHGISIEQLRIAIKNAVFDRECLTKLGHCLWSILAWKEDPTEFLGRANALARDLKMNEVHLRDPNAAPHMRQRRERRRR